MALFGKPKYTIVRVKKKEIPDGLWEKCAGCGETLYSKTLEENFNVCPKCNYHFPISARARIKMLFDTDSFLEYDVNMESADPLEFKGLKTYKDKLASDQAATGLKDAVVTGDGFIGGKKTAVAVTDSNFIMGSMGSVVGEKISRVVEAATKNKWPIIIISGSGGGARMYEGMYSLMQMAKTCAALQYHHKHNLPFISILTDPTMGGVMASFAGIGDITIAEPRALIGFAGPRVIEQTIRQKLPAGFQRSEFLMEHGFVDMIVNRKDLKTTLCQLLDYLS
ncbi:MAG: acetyl-CoA carboxylase, carboxyltransferase subunit beta [Candidatus Omnitrophica bacterium]|jgi:acetyl-CoA carboxylase carboxyl transferase subunit beta|nr:acetyl-CoA carboxylase, carboxyltransferase subunit beta [Candidatus Omnitrophota bacterium]